MRNPHVVALHYRLETGPDLILKNPEPVEHKTQAFSVRLADGHLRAEIKDDPATVADAVGELTQYLRSWEILTNLCYGSGALKWRLEDAEVVGGPPGAGVSDVLRGFLVPNGRFTFGVGGPHTLTQYPALPHRFVASPVVMSLWQRYDDYLNERERLTQVAWWCITTIEWSSGGRPQTAKRYAISDHVLKELRRLANVGDERTARKRFVGQVLRERTAAEVAWMEAVIKRIILRVGEWAADSKAEWPKITMGDFPRL